MHGVNSDATLKNKTVMNNENTIYDRNEDTQFDNTRFAGNKTANAANGKAANEETQYDDTRFADNTGQQPTANGQPRKVAMGKRVAIAFGAAAALGAGAAVLMSATTADGTENGGDGTDGGHPEWTDGHVQVAGSVNDNMSFTEAFNAARDEVGTGGVFEWHGNIYSTFTEDEWNGMSLAEREEYGSHFNWHGNGGNNDSSADAEVVASSATNDDAAVDVSVADGQTVSAEPDYTVGNDGAHGEAEAVAVSDDDVTADDEVQILGVEHDAQTGMTYAHMTFDDHDAVLVDINNDNTFDVLAVDANDDHQLSDNEMIDISDHHITAESLGIDTSVDDNNMMAGNGEQPVDDGGDGIVAM